MSTSITPALLLSLFEAVHGRAGEGVRETMAYADVSDSTSLSVSIRPGMRVEAKEHYDGGQVRSSWVAFVPVFDAAHILHGLYLPAPPADWLQRVDVEWAKGLITLALPDESPMLQGKEGWEVLTPQYVNDRLHVRFRAFTSGDHGISVEVSQDGTHVRAYHGKFGISGRMCLYLPCGLMASWLSNTRHLPVVNP